MSDGITQAGRGPVVLAPDEGRSYAMGRLSAVFKADAAETGQGYSISEWWLDPHTKGPGPHSHPTHKPEAVAAEPSARCCLEVREQAGPAALVELSLVVSAGAERVPAAMLDRHPRADAFVGGEGDLDFCRVGAVLA